MNYSENIFLKLIKKFLRNCYLAYSIFLDYLFLALFRTVKNSENKDKVFQIIKFINNFYFMEKFLRRKVIESEKSFENYVNYDANISLYQKYLEEGWFLNKKILDFGCFIGTKTFILARSGAEYVLGIDLSKRGINFAKNKFQLHNLEYRNIDILELCKSNKYENYFDYIISYTVFEHINLHDLPNIMNCFHRLASDNGFVVIVFNAYYDKYGSHLRNYIYHPWPHLIFPHKYCLEYANNVLRKHQKKGYLNYLSENYDFISETHNNDCFVALNKLKVNDFKRILQNSGFIIERAYPYSRTLDMKVLNLLFPQNEIFKGSYFYVLRKKSRHFTD